MYLINDIIPHFVMSSVAPPNKDVGVFKNFICQSMIRLVQCRSYRTYFRILVQISRNRIMDTIRVYFCDLAFSFSCLYSFQTVTLIFIFIFSFMLLVGNILYHEFQRFHDIISHARFGPSALAENFARRANSSAERYNVSAFKPVSGYIIS